MQELDLSRRNCNQKTKLSFDEKRYSNINSKIMSVWPLVMKKMMVVLLVLLSKMLLLQLLTVGDEVDCGGFVAKKILRTQSHSC